VLRSYLLRFDNSISDKIKEVKIGRQDV